MIDKNSHAQIKKVGKLMEQNTVVLKEIENLYKKKLKEISSELSADDLKIVKEYEAHTKVHDIVKELSAVQKDYQLFASKLNGGKIK